MVREVPSVEVFSVVTVAQAPASGTGLAASSSILMKAVWWPSALLYMDTAVVPRAWDPQLNMVWLSKISGSHSGGLMVSLGVSSVEPNMA